MKTFINRAVAQILEKIEDENPISQITEKEIDQFIVKVGSLITIIKNKNISPATLFITIISEPTYEHLFSKFIGTKTSLEISKILMSRYPNLLKSKLVKNSAIKIMKKRKNKEKQLHDRISNKV